MVKFVKGDMFANWPWHIEAYAQGVNCMGVMGRGIAVEFKNRFPISYLDYRAKCLKVPRRLNPGDVHIAREVLIHSSGSLGTPTILNLCTQENYTDDRATYERLEKCLNKMVDILHERKIKSVAMPRIGCGLGGLDWDIAKDIFEDVLFGYNGRAYVYEL